MYDTPLDRSSPVNMGGFSSRYSPSSSSLSAHRSMGRRGQGQGLGQGQGGQGLTTRPRIFFPPTNIHHDNDSDGSGIGGKGSVKGVDIGSGENRKESGTGIGTGIGGESPVKGISANVRRGRRVRSTYDATTTTTTVDPSTGTNLHHHPHDMVSGNGTMTMAISSAPSSYYVLPKASMPAGTHPGRRQSHQLPVKFPVKSINNSQSNSHSKPQSNLPLTPLSPLRYFQLSPPRCDIQSYHRGYKHARE